MKKEIIKYKSVLELQKQEEIFRAQLFALRIQNTLGKVEKLHIINNIRKNIARIQTELNFRIKNSKTQSMILLNNKKKKIKFLNFKKNTGDKNNDNIKNN